MQRTQQKARLEPLLYSMAIFRRKQAETSRASGLKNRGPFVGKKCYQTLACLLFTIAWSSATPLNPAVSASNAFGVDLLKKVSGDPESNAVFSPLSITTLFALVNCGSRGATQMELAKTFHFDATPKTVSEQFSTLSPTIQSSVGDPSNILNTATGLWVADRFPVLPTFTGTAQHDFLATVANANFVNHAEAERQTINEWISDKTQKRIENLLPEGSITAATALVLANAIYFRGLWETPFEKANTRLMDFHPEKGPLTEIPMMELTHSFRYAETPDLQCIEIPYKNGFLSMIVLLPKAGHSLQQCIPTLNLPQINQALTDQGSREVHLQLPRFKLTTGLNLIPVLESMGVKKAFASSADFSGISQASKLMISGAFHKALIEVDEQGTKAAAATAVTISTLAILVPIEFTADRPFLFLIQHNASGAVLFMGKVSALEGT